MAFIKNGQGSSLGVVEAPKGQPQQETVTTKDDVGAAPVQQTVKGS